MKALVYNKLNDFLRQVKKEFGEKYVFGVFIRAEDEQIVALILPTIEDIVNNNPIVNRVDIKDIRVANCHKKFLDDYLINPRYEYLFNSMKDVEMLKQKLIKRIIENNDVIRFLKQLNDVDKTIIEAILGKIGTEGVIVQSKLSIELNISKLAISNLIEKLSNSNLVEVEYFGCKGTYIKILDTILLDIRGRYANN